MLGVADHDTTSGISGVMVAAAPAGLDVVPGIEVTAIHRSKDVHVLGYFIDAGDRELCAFLSDQREDRRRRALEIADRLDRLGAPIDSGPLVSAGRESGRSVGRPMVAAALVRAGHARDISDAFDRYLSEGRPAFVERRGRTPAEVVAVIQHAGGLASIAHPGKTGVDDIIADLATRGMAAIEVFHPDHTAVDVARYRALARDLGLLVTGGSDYHGPGSGRTDGLGRVGLPADDYAALLAHRTRPREP